MADEGGGLIHDITVLQRPWGVVANFRDTTLQALADVVPLPAWELGGRKASASDRNAGSRAVNPERRMQAARNSGSPPQTRRASASNSRARCTAG